MKSRVTGGSAASPGTLVFDLETKYLADEVGGWNYIHKMGMSVAVTYSVEQDIFTTYTEPEVPLLIQALTEAQLVVGYNSVRFDYEVLSAYSFLPLRETVNSLDLMLPLHRTLGYRPKLQDLAAGTLGLGKLGDGLDAVRWFREGNMDKLIAYCKQDVRVTHEIYRFGKEQGFVLVRGKYGTDRAHVEW